MAAFGEWVRPRGLLVALVGFGITRVFVAEVVQPQTAVSYLFAGLLPLLVGLSLTVYGVGLAVGAFSREYVETVARWCLVGTLAMVLVLAVTSAGSMVQGETMRPLAGSQLLVANVLLGGAVGGALLGHRSAALRRQRREIRRQANRALLLDRLLRHEVINAVNIVSGHTALLADAGSAASDAVTAIDDALERITGTIDEVGELIEKRSATGAVDAAALLAAEVETARDRFPDLAVTLDGPTEGVEVAADGRLELVFRELLANAGEVEDITRVEATIEEGTHEVRVSVSDDGSGLPGTQRALLTAGEFPEYDDPSSGFGLAIVRLLVAQYDGQVTVEDGEGGTTITVLLPQVGAEGDLARSINVTRSNLSWAIVTGLLAGVAMGVFFAATTDVLPVIGSLYGVGNPLIGWVTHLFHSVIFAIVFAAIHSHPLVQRRLTGPLHSGLAGIAWGTVLWLVAAGLVMPLWLRAAGVMTMLPLPNLPRIGFVSHALWGGVLGVSYALLAPLELSLFRDRE